MFVQLLNLRSGSHILWQALPAVVSKDVQVVCMSEIKMSLLARSCVCPGSLALITNLLSKFEPPSSLQRRSLRKKQGRQYVLSTNSDWTEEYQFGGMHDIIHVELPPQFHGDIAHQ